MSVFEYIKEIQGRSHAERKRIASIASIAGTSFIALLWLSTLLIPTGGKHQAEEAVDVDLTPLANIGAAGADVLRSIGQLKNSFSILGSASSTADALRNAGSEPETRDATSVTATATPELLKAIEVLKKTNKKATTTAVSR